MSAADRTIASLAARQFGAFTSAQAQMAGLSIDQVRHRVATGRWRRPTRGVFVLAGVPDGPEQRAAIAQLARPSGVLSHGTAAALAGLSVPAPPQPILTVPPNASGRSTTAAIHRLHLPPSLVVAHGALRCTAVSRTLVDIATTVGPRRLAKVVDEAMHLRATTVRAVAAAMDDAPHLTAAPRGALLDALEVWRSGIAPGSPAEARLLRLLDQWGLPAPERQVIVRDAQGDVVARLDAGWSDRRLGLDYDSTRWHGPDAWAHDEARHALVTRLGWRLEHVDKFDLAPGRHALRGRLLAAYHAPTGRLAHPA
jgi:hypothetical protein